MTRGGSVPGALAFTVGLLLLGAVAKDKVDRVAQGTWGGQGIGLEVTETGARVEYDCARGTVDQAMTLDADGRFDSRGTYASEGPGPIREGESKGRPAQYSGQLQGETMTLTVKLVGADEVIGTFTLVHGKFPRIRKCS